MIERFSKSVLPNGVRVLTESMPETHSVSMGIWVAVGSRDEEPHYSGISHFIEHMIFKGTARRSALDIAKVFDQMGGLSNAFTTKEATCFHARVLDSHLDRVVELFSDIFLNSRFDSGEVEKERQVILQEISMVQDLPDDLVYELFNAFYWPENGLGRSILGNEETVREIDSENLKAYVERAYTGSKVLVTAAGNIEHDAFMDKIGGLFGTVGARNGYAARLRPIPNLRVKFYPRALEQAHILVGFQGPSSSEEERYAALLLNAILGGSMSSRLFQEVREKRGLAYSIYSFFSSYEDVGMIGIYAGVSPGEVATVVDITRSELANIADGPLLAEEIEAARDYIKGGLLLSAENTDTRMTRLAKNEINLGTVLTYEEVLRSIDAVTEEKIKELAGGCLRAGASMVCLGPVKDSDVGRCEILLSSGHQ
jgi:predicted Zn-dependent peptidase